MCLRINSVPKVAEEDIICYKMLEERDQDRWRGYTYRSPFQELPIKDEIVLGLWPYVGLGDRSIKDINGYPSVSEGYIHTYKTLLNAEEGNTASARCSGLIRKGISIYHMADFATIQNVSSAK